VDTASLTIFLTLMVIVFNGFCSCSVLTLEMILQLFSSTKADSIGLKLKRYPENIIPILQPPHSLELNPIERYGAFLKAKLQA